MLAMGSRVRGDEKAADGLIASLESIVEDEHEEDLLAVAKAPVARVTPAGRFDTILHKALKTPPRPYKPKRR